MPVLWTPFAMAAAIVAGPAIDAPLLMTQASQSDSPQAMFNRAIAEFEGGRFAASADSFDRLITLVPESMPQLWQRGIALYYARRYADCRRQFESHRTVNPDDVENAAWHFLCVARQESPDKARAALLPVGPDSRVPMREIYAMFQGRVDPAAVIAAAGANPQAQFYARLYVGLYSEALGRNDAALEHLTAAASSRFAAAGGYMHTVARVHVGVLRGESK